MAKVIAKITYHAGKSYRMAIPGRPVAKFFQDRTVTITDPVVIERCQNTAGFTVTIVGLKSKKKVRTPIVEEKSSKKKKPSIATSTSFGD